MEVEEAWESFKKTSVSGMLQTMMSDIQEMKTNTKRTAEMVPQMMGNAAMGGMAGGMPPAMPPEQPPMEDPMASMPPEGGAPPEEAGEEMPPEGGVPEEPEMSDEDVNSLLAQLGDESYANEGADDMSKIEGEESAPAGPAEDEIPAGGEEEMNAAADEEEAAVADEESAADDVAIGDESDAIGEEAAAVADEESAADDELAGALEEDEGELPSDLGDEIPGDLGADTGSADPSIGSAKEMTDAPSADMDSDINEAYANLIEKLKGAVNNAVEEGNYGSIAGIADRLSSLEGAWNDGIAPALNDIKKSMSKSAGNGGTDVNAELTSDDGEPFEASECGEGSAEDGTESVSKSDIEGEQDAEEADEAPEQEPAQTEPVQKSALDDDFEFTSFRDMMASGKHHLRDVDFKMPGHEPFAKSGAEYANFEFTSFRDMMAARDPFAKAVKEAGASSDDVTPESVDHSEGSEEEMTESEYDADNMYESDASHAF